MFHTCDLKINAFRYEVPCPFHGVTRVLCFVTFVSSGGKDGTLCRLGRRDSLLAQFGPELPRIQRGNLFLNLFLQVPFFLSFQT